jgi:hypothetical protein
MFDLNTIFEFSRTNCVAICAFLVPANLLLTLQTIIFTGLHRPQAKITKAALLACIPAILMVLHVFTWLMIGVIMAPTYILLCLGSTCLGLNLWAITNSQSMVRLLQALWEILKVEKFAFLRK